MRRSIRRDLYEKKNEEELKAEGIEWLKLKEVKPERQKVVVRMLNEYQYSKRLAKLSKERRKL